MKRTVAVCALFALLAGALAGPADAARRRVAREAVDTYALPWPSSPSTGEGCFGDDNCPSFRVSRSERWVSVEVIDGSGTPSAFEITETSGTGGATPITVGGPFCGSSGKEPVRVTSGAKVTIRVYAVGDTVCPGSVGTSGTVKAVFSNVP